jgi:predicted sugar kinase
MEGTSSKWSKAVEKAFKKEVYEKKIVVNIPKARKGKFASKEFEVMKHLKSCPCPPQEAIEEEEE